MGDRNSAIFGFGMGLWCSAWLALANPAIPFFLSYLFFFWFVWRLNIERKRT